MANKGPRDGITYGQVAAAADAMLGKGLEPTIRGIRDVTGGSPNTVHKHLTAWRDAQPKTVTEAPVLPANLAAAFAAEITRAAAEAKSEVETRLVQVQGEAVELATAGEVLESERDSLLEQVDDLKVSCNTLTGKSQEQANEISRLASELERERLTSEQGRIEIAQSRNRVESLAETLAEKAAAIDRLTATHAADLERITSSCSTEAQARTAAEKNCAVLQSRLESLGEKLNEKAADLERLVAASTAEGLARVAAEKTTAVLQAQLEAALEQVEGLKAREGNWVAEAGKERQAAELERAETKALHEKLEGQAGKIAELQNELARQKNIKDPE